MHRLLCCSGRCVQQCANCQKCEAAQGEISITPHTCADIAYPDSSNKHFDQLADALQKYHTSSQYEQTSQPVHVRVVHSARTQKEEEKKTRGLTSSSYDERSSSHSHNFRQHIDEDFPVSSQPYKSTADNMLILVASELQDCTLNDWLRQWCTPDNIHHHIKMCKGDVARAAKLLAKTLEWRQKHEDILSGRRVPLWQGDMRVLTVGNLGHPLILLSMIQQPKHTKPDHIVDHVVAVLETAVNLMQGGASQFDVVCDCWGFTLRKNMNPRPVVATLDMLRLPYKKRLRYGLIVDAPKSFEVLWNAVSRALPETLKNRISFASLQQAVNLVSENAGHHSAQLVEHALRHNRDATRTVNFKLPSETNDLYPIFACAAA